MLGNLLVRWCEGLRLISSKLEKRSNSISIPGGINNLWHPLLTPFFIMMCLGMTFNFIGQNTPLLNNLGLGFILCIVVPSYLVHKGYISYWIAEYFDKMFFNKSNTAEQGIGINFSQFFITIVIAGSICGIETSLLKNSIKRFIPLTLLAVLGSFLITGCLGYLLHYRCPGIFGHKSRGPFYDSIFFVAIPLTNGGTNLGINGFSNSLYHNYFKKDSSSIRTAIIAPLILARVLSIFFAAFLNLALDNTELSGRGNLDKSGYGGSGGGRMGSDSMANFQSIGAGFLMIFTLYSLGNMLNYYIVQQGGMRFRLDAMVYVIAVLLLIKLFDILPQEEQSHISQAGNFMTSIFTAPVLAALGLTTNFGELMSCVLDRNILFMVIMSFSTVIISTLFLAKLFNFYPLEAALTAGICSHSIGGTGNIGVMSVSNRINLLPFAMIATRIVGPIVFSLATFSFGYVYR
ncbi:malate:citrate symporter [Texas Phoenix palm phytoplasma]|uniref:Malate:citrate symporter n=1 Tax=Texas Phoenix palm phytoplasma TaxID=176709 RepID=A0ABS5BI97_9MOLU|nr:2-hydroxycarboxylate transporter family protein [Texas Phoenix palm phytoplasma]MBP3059302.1 malate:citrate symporter [Texas Phoenix palm phytoplasma]